MVLGHHQPPPRLRLTVITPLLVGGGDKLAPIDYMVWKDQVNVLDQPRIFRLLSKGPRLEGYLGQLHAYSPDPAAEPPVTVVVDELRHVLYPGFTTAVALTRKTGARFLLAQQSIWLGQEWTLFLHIWEVATRSPVEQVWRRHT